jgi:hypothetical protein
MRPRLVGRFEKVLAVAVIAVVASLFFAKPARAAPWFDWGEDATEDQFADGDLDEEDHVAMHLGAHPGASGLRGESWVSVLGFERQLLSGKNDIGAMLVVGLALDRIATGPVHGLADPPSAAPAPAPAMPAPVEPLVADSMARQCVAAAWRTSGLGVDDERIDSLVARSRASALLPETRFRAMRLWDDASHATTLATTADTSYYDAIGANLVLELRLTWRLDRLLYASDEPTLERVRLERQDARMRLATRTLEALSAWQRATIEGRNAVAGSREAIESSLRAAEAEATLAVLTGGWFKGRDLDQEGGDQ